MALTDKLRKYSGIALDLATISVGAGIFDYGGNYEFDNLAGSAALSSGIVAGYHIAKNITHDFKTYLTNRNVQGLSTAIATNLLVDRIQNYTAVPKDSLENWTIFALAATATTLALWDGKKEENRIAKLKK